MVVPSIPGLVGSQGTSGSCSSDLHLWSWRGGTLPIPSNTKNIRIIKNQLGSYHPMIINLTSLKWIYEEKALKIRLPQFLFWGHGWIRIAPDSRWKSHCPAGLHIWLMGWRSEAWGARQTLIESDGSYWSSAAYAYKMNNQDTYMMIRIYIYTTLIHITCIIYSIYMYLSLPTWLDILYKWIFTEWYRMLISSSWWVKEAVLGHTCIRFTTQRLGS